MSDGPQEIIQNVIGTDYKRPFMMLVAVITTVGVVLLGLGKAEDFVDGRVELKIQTERQKAEEQANKMSKMEEQLGLMRDTLSEIRADVRVLRARVETKTDPH